jgi:MSHA biogenesis protein MshG
MPSIFHYEGRDANGRSVSGDLSVNTIDDVISYLKKRNITPIHVDVAKRRTLKFSKLLSLNIGQNKVPLYDVMNFCRQLAALNGAGVPLIRAINQLAQSSKSQHLKETLITVTDEISAGLSLGNSLKKHPEAFSPIVVNIIDIGENTGHLNEALIQLGNYLESTITNNRRLLSAIRYPSFVFISILAAIILMNFFVVPKFTMMFASFKAELPLPTLIIMRSSDFMVKHGWALLIVVIGILLLGFRLLKIPGVRYFWDKHRLSLPIFGNLQKRIILSQFTWTFSLILRSGVPIIKGLTLAANSTENSYFSKQLLTIRDAIDHGESFSQATNNCGLFTPTTVQMIEVGEESGKLDELLAEVAKYYDNEVDYDLRRINELIEPFLLMIIGSMVLILALGIYLPMWNLIKVTQI